MIVDHVHDGMSTGIAWALLSLVLRYQMRYGIFAPKHTDWSPHIRPSSSSNR